MKTNGYYAASIKAILLHIVALSLFVFSGTETEKQAITKPPTIVHAKVLVMEDPAKAKKKKENLKRKTAQKKAAKKKRDLAKKRKKALDKRKALERKKKLAAKAKAEKKKKAAAKKQAENKRKTEAAKRKKKAETQRKEQLAEQERLRAIQNRELDITASLDAENEYLKSQTNTEISNSYISIIQQKIIGNWHRPLSARNGMQAILMIHLVPTGEVQNVYLTKSSGDAAFDRSVIQAVQRAGKFEELQQLSPRQFDANFRAFRIVFKPEDLIR